VAREWNSPGWNGGKRSLRFRPEAAQARAAPRRGRKPGKAFRGDREIVKETGLSSMAVVPIVHKRGFLGLLAVGNLSPGRPLTQSDVNLLSGGCFSGGNGHRQVRLSFEKLKEAKKNTASLWRMQTASSCGETLREDHLFNEYAQRFFGLSAKEIWAKPW